VLILRAQPAETSALRFPPEVIIRDARAKSLVQVAERLKVFLLAPLPVAA
jgi:hypothetical protein